MAQFLLGVLATSIGIGIGLPHAAKAGIAVLTVAGLVAFVAGLVLLLVAAARLGTRLRSWRRLIVIPIALVLLVFVVAPIAIAVAATNVPRTAVGSTTPADVGLTYDRRDLPHRRRRRSRRLVRPI